MGPKERRLAFSIAFKIEVVNYAEKTLMMNDE